jgi:hypothetical protein
MRSFHGMLCLFHESAERSDEMQQESSYSMQQECSHPQLRARVRLRLVSSSAEKFGKKLQKGETQRTAKRPRESEQAAGQGLAGCSQEGWGGKCMQHRRLKLLA